MVNVFKELNRLKIFFKYNRKESCGKTTIMHKYQMLKHANNGYTKNQLKKEIQLNSLIICRMLIQTQLYRVTEIQTPPREI